MRLYQRRYIVRVRLNGYDYDEDIEPWQCLDEVKPLHGQLCLIKSVDIAEAYYSVSRDDEFKVVKNIDQGRITAWRPVYDTDTDMHVR